MNDVPRPHDTKVITVANQKGGVGKSTNSINIAAALGERGYRCLLIDLDVTSGATKALGVPTKGWVGVFELITAEEEPEGCIIDETEEEISLPRGVHFIPSSRKLIELDAWLTNADNRWANPLDILSEPLAKLQGQYDFIFLDTPPQITKTSLPAFKVADYVILTATPEKLAVDGLADALADINNAQRAGNAELQLLGVIICSFARGRTGKAQTRLARQLIEYVEQNLLRPDGSSYKFETDVTRSVSIQEAQKMGQSILEYAPESTAAEQYRELAKEVLTRLGRAPMSTLVPQPKAGNPSAPSTPSATGESPASDAEGVAANA